MSKNYSPFRTYFANDVSALVPELWANESLLILEENMVMGNLVHRDFSPLVADYGQIVHTRKPAEFEALRKTGADEVYDQDVTASGVNVTLNQLVHVSFVIKDYEMSLAFKNLVELYLHPAMLANARMLDRVLAAQAIQFVGNSRGGLGQLSKTNAADSIVDMRDLFNQNKVYDEGRNLVLASSSEAQMLKTQMFMQAFSVGDNGTAMERALLGKKYGFNTLMDINTPSCRCGTIAATNTTTSAAAVAGATTVAIGAAVGKGRYVTVAGENTPMRSTTNDTTLTPTRPFQYGCANGAVVSAYGVGAVNLSDSPTDGLGNAVTALPAGWIKQIQVDGLAEAPKVGQMVSFNTGDTSTGTVLSKEYVIIAVKVAASNATPAVVRYNITLDQPLANALVDNDTICMGPAGDYNFAFHRNALALVNRPLATPIEGTGARSSTATYKGLSMRVVITYDGKAQGHRVTFDSIFGAAVLDTALGGVLLG